MIRMDVKSCGGGVREAQQTLQFADSGASPTSPHQLKFKKITYWSAIQFLVEHHYLHRKAPVSFSFGAFFEDRLVGALTIGKPASYTLIEGVAGKENADRVFELNRLFMLDDMPKNSESRFIGWCIRQLPKGLILVSYADTAQGHVGVVYKATGWRFTGTSIPFTDNTIEGLDHRSVPKELRKNNPRLIKKERSIKNRYVMVLDGDYSVLKWSIKPYQK